MTLARAQKQISKLRVTGGRFTKTYQMWGQLNRSIKEQTEIIRKFTPGFGLDAIARSRISVPPEKNKNKFAPRLRRGSPKPRKTVRHSQTDAPAFSHVAIANQYARDIVAARIPACKWVKLACQRHLINDLGRAKVGWNYVFDDAKANRACEFIEELPHTKGDWASRGEQLRLSPWQVYHRLRYLRLD